MSIKNLNKRLFYFVTGAIAIVFSGCLKDPGIEQIGVQIRFTNVSPDAGSIQFKLNGENATTSALGYSDTSGYLAFKGGTYNFSVDAGAKTPVNTVVDFIPKTSYSIFLTDSANRAALRIFKDDFTEPAPLYIKLRFFNFIPNAGTLTLAGITPTDTMALAPSVSFNTSSNLYGSQQFYVLPSNLYELVLVSGNTIVSRLPRRAFVNKIYTVYARGVLGVTGSMAPTLSIIQHN